jgi:flagellar biosynthesis protein FlhB
LADQEKSNEERTEQATQFRREEFRKQGTVALSRELLSIAILIGSGAALWLVSRNIFSEFGLLSQKYFSFAPFSELNREEFLDLRVGLAKSFGWMAVPVLMTSVVMAFLASAAQVGWYVTFEPLNPNWDRVNPFAGFKRLFSSRGAMEAVKALLKMAIVSLIVWSFLKGEASGAAHYFSRDLAEATSLTLSTVGKFFFTIVISLSLISILDYAFQRYQLEQQMKMTKREAKEEFKLREGDPLIKSRIRSIQRRLASRRMMDQVPKADVVVTNPTHFAVALKYDAEKMHAPRVVAKGAGVIALKIKEIARFHHIPTVENKPLARNLYKTLDVGEYVPRELYKAVAEVLAYVYRLRNRRAVAYG